MTKKQAAEAHESVSAAFAILGSFEDIAWYCSKCIQKNRDEADAKVRATLSRRDYRHLS